jgi:hypothetical protein
LLGDGCDQHCVASQPAGPALRGDVPDTRRKARRQRAFAFSRQSTGSDFWHFESEMADSLRPTFERLPFLGDCDWRPGSMCTAWPSLQWNVAKFFAMAADKLGMLSPHCRADAREHSALTGKGCNNPRTSRGGRVLSVSADLQYFRLTVANHHHVAGSASCRVCQLRSQDIKQIDGIWCIAFAAEAGSLRCTRPYGMKAF